MSQDKLELTKADVDAVIDYLFIHVRASPRGRAYKVWERMLAFQSRVPDDEEKQLTTETDLYSL
jgi:hypothetical protein